MERRRLADKFVANKRHLFVNKRGLIERDIWRRAVAVPLFATGIKKQPEKRIEECCFSFAETRFARFQAAFIYKQAYFASHKPHRALAAFFQAAFQLQAGEQGLGIGKGGNPRLFDGDSKIACHQLLDAGDFAA